MVLSRFGRIQARASALAWLILTLVLLPLVHADDDDDDDDDHDCWEDYSGKKYCHDDDDNHVGPHDLSIASRVAIAVGIGTPSPSLLFLSSPLPSHPIPPPTNTTPRDTAIALFASLIAYFMYRRRRAAAQHFYSSVAPHEHQRTDSEAGLVPAPVPVQERVDGRYDLVSGPPPQTEVANAGAGAGAGEGVSPLTLPPTVKERM
ncbi:hypothetical protein DENSPDRAFT_843385 [Dentipellis sp. KUC8613]|nr:hypothetical protein DENSPDRAFT_843385 [Dentipellis sp. KUC8613]